MNFDSKRNALLAITALVVAYVRQVIQYHEYSWNSLGQFAISWFIHYIAVWLIVAITYALIKGFEKSFLDPSDSPNGLSIDQALVYIPIVLIVVAISIFILMHLALQGSFDE